MRGRLLGIRKGFQTTATPRRRTAAVALALVSLTLVPLAAQQQQRRARPPQFDADSLRGVFYDDLSTVVSRTRPSATELRGAARPAPAMAADASPAAPAASIAPAATAAAAASAAADPDAATAGGSGWQALVRPLSLEDEVKRVKLHFDAVITAPGPFMSGGYQEARHDLSILATLFAVIAEHEGEVRWQADAAAARDLLARTARNAKSGSVQVYNEAKLRKADLQDLVSGAGLSDRDAEPQSDWSMIVDRAPLMEYLEAALEDHLKPSTASEQELAANVDDVRRYGEMVAVVGRVLTRQGMADADDPDYQALSQAMIAAALQLRTALDSQDPAAARQAVGAIGQSCTACHDQYR